MKKLMIAVAAAAVSVVVNAGTVTWSSSTLYTPDADGDFTSTEVANNAVTGYLIMLTESQFSAFNTTYTKDGYDAMAASVYDAYKSSLASQTSAKSTDGLVKLTDGVKYSSGDDVYAAIIYTTTVGEKEYYIANIGDYTAKSSNKTVLDFGVTELGAGTSGTENELSGWTAVPEPTSGLLLLLGMAGLALRRRRA